MKRRAETAKSAEKANKQKLNSPFVRYCVTAVACLLLTSVALCFLIFKTDTVINVSMEQTASATKLNRTTVKTVLAQVDENENKEADINIPGLPDNSGSMYAGVTTPGGGSGLTELIDGWLQLYDGPTVASDSAYEVHIPLESDGVAGGYTARRWSMGEGDGVGYNPYIRDSYSDKANNVGPGGVGRVNSSGRYWVALGPNVTNQDFKCDSSGAGAGAGEWKVDGKFIDVVLKSVTDGKEYYLPVVLGDSKAHTAPTGIVQSGTHIHNADNHPENDDDSIVEFTYCDPRKASALNSKFEIVKMIVYPAQG